MIEIIYHGRIHSLEMNGHAKSGDAGHDLVCAAASMLAYTLAADVSRAEDSGMTEVCLVNLDEGAASIYCKPKKRMDGLMTFLFDSVCTGFQLLANQYPDSVRYRAEG